MTVICFWYSRSDFGFGRVKGKSLSGHRLQRKGSARSVKGASSVKLHYIREKLSALTETLMLKSDSELLNYYNWWFETSQTAGSPLWAAVELTLELLCSLNWLFVTLSAWTAPEPCLILSGVLAASEMKKNKKTFRVSMTFQIFHSLASPLPHSDFSSLSFGNFKRALSQHTVMWVYELWEAAFGFM